MSDLIIPNTFVTGNAASAVDVNMNFNAITERLNGGLDLSNFTTQYYQDTIVIPFPNVTLTTGQSFQFFPVITIPDGQTWEPVQVTLWLNAVSATTLYVNMRLFDTYGPGVVSVALYPDTAGLPILSDMTYDINSDGDDDGIHVLTSGSRIHTSFNGDTVLAGGKHIIVYCRMTNTFVGTTTADDIAGVTFTYKAKLGV